ncbi:capsule biosynthesis protein [uncultured Roseobacter sp.]|uniref:capsule biosynthesis protein n=1 Tax=uncultured Roseobacter sp. TaxID=114847 RepID=UPI002606A59C|nr:capsule biosynthesis protein [uncultured Roseobacter sp.]
MTTKPTARKFRIKRTSPGLSAKDANPADRPLAPETAAEEQEAKAQSQKPAASADTNTENVALELDAIRREGLTGRQLRMARRVAHKNGLAPTSDFDAVRLLRARGIDPFQRSNMLELVVPKNPNDPTQETGTEGKQNDENKKSGRIQLPQTMPVDRETLPSTEHLSPAEMRDRQISEIQQDITRRRRRKMGMLLARLAFFVMLPTVIAGWYFYAVATPMYSTKSEFLILQADSAGGSAIGGLLSGTQFATSQDSIAVQSYLQSKDAMLRLDSDVGFKSHFSAADIDPVQRLAENPSNEQAYKTYKKNVKVGYDPTEGVLRMEVIAADPNVSANMSQALIDYAEDRVNNLSQKKRGDQMAEAQTSFENAETERREAQEALVTLQLQGDTLDPQAVIAGLRGQINQVELQLLEKELQLAALLDNARPNQSRVDGARGDVRRLNEQLDELNARMTDASQGENSLAQLNVRIQMAQADLATRDMLLQSALQQMEQTRMEANRQVRYLTVSVKPLASEEPSYPRKFENTLVAFLIFAGVYLMVSLTASILREQVTS